MNNTSQHISCKGIRTHNLKNIDIDIPKGKWVCITGVSGSGKSSLAFDTLFSESQRRFLETLGTYERQFLEGIPNGEFDSIENLPPAIALKQAHRANDPRSVIATASDLGEPIRLLFALTMEPSCARCGTPVITSDIKTLLESLHLLFQNPDSGGAILAVPYAWPARSDESISITKQMLAEGYSRIVIDGNITLTEEVIESKKNLSGTHLLVLDRIGAPCDTDELTNRVSTVWSQVRYSPKFQSICLIPLHTNGTLLWSSPQHFQTDAFCPHCETATTIIQQGDLDWQSALGACPRCEGLGNIPVIDESKVIPDSSKSLSTGAIKPWSTPSFSWLNDAAIKSLGNSKDLAQTPYAKLTPEVKRWIWSGDNSGTPNCKNTEEFSSIQEFFDALDAERYKQSSRILLAKYRHYITCPQCEGTRLNESGRNAMCAGLSFHQVMTSEIHAAHAWLKQLQSTPRYKHLATEISDLFNEVSRKIQLLQRLGLGFASLWRRCKTLSGGEYQRVLLARVLGNGLTDALYILDEPSVGLGKAELPELIACLKELRDLGNTIVMVEHDKQLIESADLWFELGPGGGANGGKLLSRQSHMPKSATSEKPSKASSNRLPRPQSTESTETISLREFSALNCNAISCSFKTGTLSVITGPSGAGKSTLLHMGLEAALNLAKEHGQLSNPTPDIGELRGAWKGLLLPTNFFQTTSLIALEQNATHRSISSVIATSLGIMDFIRRQFAQSEDALRNNMSSSEFSFNSTGACENCDGKGEIPQDLFFLGEVKKACPNCAGTRFRASSLRPKWMNRNIAEWMSTTIDECLVHWDPFPLPRKQLRVAADLGLGYLPIGTSTSSLSGGELQRLRIAAALSQSTKKMLALLDEPTRGLSESDASKLLHTLLKLTRLGHTFVVVEHHALFCENAHQLLVMGPGGGQKGGQIIETLVQNTISN